MPSGSRQGGGPRAGGSNESMQFCGKGRGPGGRGTSSREVRGGPRSWTQRVRWSRPGGEARARGSSSAQTPGNPRLKAAYVIRVFPTSLRGRTRPSSGMSSGPGDPPCVTAPSDLAAQGRIVSRRRSKAAACHSSHSSHRPAQLPRQTQLPQDPSLGLLRPELAHKADPNRPRVREVVLATISLGI